MDKAAAAKMLAGTIARGILWIAAAIATKYGVETINEDTAYGLAAFAAAVVVAGVSAWWSSRKNAKLLKAIPDK